MNKIFFSFIFLALFLSVHAPFAHSRPVPRLTGPVVDQAGIFNSSIRENLSRRLRKFNQDTKIQLQVLTIKSLEEDNLEEFSIRVGETWKIGDTKLDQGVILLFVQKERKVRIEVGQGLEGQIPDAKAGRIINNTMIPLFKQNAYADGIILGLSEIARATGHKLSLGKIQPIPPNSYRNKRKGRAIGDLIFMLFWAVFIAISIFSPRKRGRYGLGGFWYGGGGGFGGFSGGGGGWSGGGGGFSGGGASGGW